ncbi:MAG: UvrD-helicase domain-containing protein [Oscillospiraceae bacterium]|nr:UvrD-helicase domain-containing protein [Oscillospiraceae bacterium]
MNTTAQQSFEEALEKLNPMQREAVLRTEGPLLIIAGAGSGKTTVLCYRVANIINKGTAPWRILAVTFTNKAAAELKTRLSKMNVNADDVWAGTFHSTCVKILRRGIEAIGFKSNFTIYDTDDSLRVIKACMSDLNMSDKAWNPKQIQNMISRAKDKLQTPEEFVTVRDGKTDFILEVTQQIYNHYQKRLKTSNALDFDDLIMKTVELLEAVPEVLEKWQRQFEYIMIDEYQDTNHAQYKLISLLTRQCGRLPSAGNLCVVGDEDQSIYRFRGATIENILSFEEEFKAFTVKLEQNYRSTETILEAANGVIKNNTQRKNKTLWSNLGKGEKIEVHTFLNERSESRFIAETIAGNVQDGRKYSDNCVLYRMNAQSRTVELALAASGIPYRIIGGVRFYERKEIKDILAYLNVIENPDDTVRLRRIINVPKRSIGSTTQAEIEKIASGLGINPIEVMERSEEYATLYKRAKVLVPFAAVLRELGSSERYLPDLIDDVLEQSGYAEMLRNEGTEGEMRLQNINELKSAAVRFCEENPDSGLSGFLEQAALIADMDSYDGDEDKCVLMSMHAAKGLEFDTVFITGAEENIFPSYKTADNPIEVEEERRLAYVAITRAKRRLYATAAQERLIFGHTQRNKLTRFIREIPPVLVLFQKEDSPVIIKSTEKNTAYVPVSGVDKNRAAVNSNPQAVYTDGERVNHKIFGQGTVIGVNPMGGDTLLEIMFDKVGTKKIMANFAKIEKL